MVSWGFSEQGTHKIAHLHTVGGKDMLTRVVSCHPSSARVTLPGERHR